MDPNRPRPTRGRPRRKEQIRHILFKASTYDTWMKKKFEMGFKGITNSEFAEVLLHCASVEARNSDTDDRNRSPGALSSKDQARSCREPFSAPAEFAQPSSLLVFEENQDDGNVDIIGLSEVKSCFFADNSVTQSLQEVNPMHGSMSENSFHCGQSSSDSNTSGRSNSREPYGSSVWDDGALTEDNAASSPVEIELVLTKSMTNKPVAGSQEVVSWKRKDAQRKPFTSDANMNLSRTRYITLTKEGFVHLMFRCLECSSECRIRGKGRGVNLTFRQECLDCCNYRVWTSQAADGPNNNCVFQQVDTTQPAEVSVPVREEHETVNEEELSLLMETHEDSDEEEDPNLALISDETANPTYPESSDTLTADEELFIDEYSGEEHADKESDKSSQNGQEQNFDVYLQSSSDEANVCVDEEFTDENRSEELAVKVSEKSSEKRQPEDSDEYLPSSSNKALESCDEEISKKGITEKPFQNTIKPVIWCIECKAVAKMFCVIQRHRKYYCCAECVSGDRVEDLSLKDFTVHFSDAQGFRMHAIAEHCANLYEHKICQDCNKTFRVEMDPNKKGHVCEYKIKPFSCNVCHKRFITEIGQKVHYRRLHRDYQHACKYCMMVFDTKQSKLEHEQSHKDDRLCYMCPDCPEMFKDFVTRNEHLKTHQGKKKYTCSTCNRKFAELYRYERHLRIHSGEKPYKCTVCDRSFNQDGHLKSHMRLHTGEKPFLCEHCGESFNHNISLKNHRQRQHGIDSSCVPAEENTEFGGLLRNEDQPGRQRKMHSTADDEMESCESDSDEEQQKRGQKRKSRRKKRVKSYTDS